MALLRLEFPQVQNPDQPLSDELKQSRRHILLNCPPLISFLIEVLAELLRGLIDHIFVLIQLAVLLFDVDRPLEVSVKIIYTQFLL